MLTFTIRRLAFVIPRLLFAALVIFLLLDLAPGDRIADQPLTIPPAMREEMRRALGLDQPVHVRFGLWLYHLFVVEPLVLIDHIFGTAHSARQVRVISWQFKSPVMDIIVQRLPKTLWVVGAAYVVGVLIAIPVGIISATRESSVFDRIGTFISMVGLSVPTFVAGVLLILVFSVNLGWFPSAYDTRLRVTDWGSFLQQFRQMALPVFVLALFIAAQICRCMRAFVLDNLSQDYVRAARAKGMDEHTIVLRHVLRNSMIPVMAVMALGVPSVFAGVIITEHVFKVNGLGALLISAINANDLPMMQTLTFSFAVLIVLFKLVADVLCGALDPRTRHD